MQIRISIGGFGLGIAGDLGVSFGKAAHLSIRNAPREGAWSVSIYDHVDFPSDGPHTIMASVLGEWFVFNASAHPWLQTSSISLEKRCAFILKTQQQALVGILRPLI